MFRTRLRRRVKKLQKFAEIQPNRVQSGTPFMHFLPCVATRPPSFQAFLQQFFKCTSLINCLSHSVTYLPFPYSVQTNLYNSVLLVVFPMQSVKLSFSFSVYVSLSHWHFLIPSLKIALQNGALNCRSHAGSQYAVQRLTVSSPVPEFFQLISLMKSHLSNEIN